MELTRFERRVISRNVFDFHDRNYNQNELYYGSRFTRIREFGVALFYYGIELEEDLVDALVQLIMESYAIHYKYSFKKLLLIGTTKDLRQFKWGYVGDIKPFKYEVEQAIKSDYEKLGWFTNEVHLSNSEKEYPDV